MAKEKGYRIEVSSAYEEFWRYNVALMCGCFDAEDTRTGFVTSEDAIAAVGANLKAAPEGYPTHRISMLEAPEADHLVLYVYVIPHTLPMGSDIARTDSFPLRVRVTYSGREVLKNDYRINQWSGASIELKVVATPKEG